MSDLPLVVCDVETTGLSDSQHRVIEVSYARVEQGDWDAFSIKTFRFELSPMDYARGEPRAFAVNGYYRNHPEWKNAPVLDSPEAWKLWEQIKNDLTGVILCNQNVKFDEKFLLGEMSRHAKRALDEPPWHNYTWEVGAFTKQHMKKAGHKGWALHKAYDVIGGPKLPEHRAEADVLRAIWVLAEGMIQFPKTWTDFKMDAHAAKAAVEKWAKMRVPEGDDRPEEESFGKPETYGRPYGEGTPSE